MENNPRTETSVYSIDVIGYFPSWNPTTSPSEVSLSGNEAWRLNYEKYRWDCTQANYLCD
jgi:hypothetical protein